MIPADKLKLHVQAIVGAARTGGYPAALRQYKRIVLGEAMSNSDAIILGTAVNAGLRDAGITIKEQGHGTIQKT